MIWVPQSARCARRCASIRCHPLSTPRWAVAFTGCGDGTGGAETLRATLEANPDFGHARWSLGRVLLEQGRPEEALTCFEQALEVMAQIPARWLRFCVKPRLMFFRIP